MFGLIKSMRWFWACCKYHSGLVAWPKGGLIFPWFLLSRNSITAPVEWSVCSRIASDLGSLLVKTNFEQSFAETKPRPKLGQTVIWCSRKKEEIRENFPLPSSKWASGEPFLCGIGHLMGSDSALTPHFSSRAVFTFLQNRYYLHLSIHTGERARDLP